MISNEALERLARGYDDQISVSLLAGDLIGTRKMLGTARNEAALLRERVRNYERDLTSIRHELSRCEAMLGPQKPMSAEEVMETGFYQTRNYEDDWTIVYVTRRLGGGFRERQFYCASDCELSGQYIGPIKMPEV